MLFEQGDAGDAFYILIQGRVGMYRKQLLTGWRLSGEELVSEYRTEMEAPWFGEVALVQQPAVRGATARCLEACKVFVVYRTSFKAFLEICPGFAQVLAQTAKSVTKINSIRERRGSLLRAARKMSVMQQAEVRKPSSTAPMLK